MRKVTALLAKYVAKNIKHKCIKEPWKESRRYVVTKKQAAVETVRRLSATNTESVR